MNRLFLILSALSFICSCTDDPYQDGFLWGDEGMPEGLGGPGVSASGALNDLGTLSDFTVEFNESPFVETENVPEDESHPDFNSYIENNFSAKDTTVVRFSASGPQITGVVKGDTVTVEDGNVVVKAHGKGLVLKASGQTSKGSIRIYSDKKFELLLSDASVCNPNGAAVNIQSGNCFVVLDGSNTLTDGTSADYAKANEEDEKAVFFSEDDLRFGGNGTLNIIASNSVGKSCLASDDAVFFRPGINLKLRSGALAGHGVKANDAIVLRGGVFNIQVEAKGKKAFTSDGIGTFAGGRVTAITAGGVDDTDKANISGASCIKTDSTLVISGGEHHLKSTGQGGKGISCDQDILINGGEVYVLTTGNMYGTPGTNPPGGMWGRHGSADSDDTVSPKGIKGDGDITISGGDIFVRTSGTNAEGIESKATLSFTGGNTAVSAYDDGLNAAKAVNVSGGRVFAASTGEGDGIDSNGSISATGGVMIGIASALGSEEGIDLENSTFVLSNATVIGIGGGMGNIGRRMGNMGGNIGGMGNRYDGHYVSTTVSGEAGTCIALTKDSTPLVTFRLPRTYNGINLLLSTPSLTSGTCQLLNNTTPHDGTLWMNIYEKTTSVDGGSSSYINAN